MNQILVEREQVNNFRYVYTHDEGIISKQVELEYASSLFTEIIRVKIWRGACATNRVIFESDSGFIKMELAPDYLGFDYHNARARFILPNDWSIVLEFNIDSDMGTPYFTITLEEC